MEGLQRSGMSFRRQGSSGLVWDDKLIQELNQAAEKDGDGVPSSVDQKDHQKPDLRRTRSDGGGARRAYKPVKVEQAEDPPSPRLSGCGFCSVFGDLGPQFRGSSHRNTTLALLLVRIEPRTSRI